MAEIIRLPHRTAWVKVPSKYQSRAPTSHLSTAWIEAHNPFRFRILASGHLVVESDDWQNIPLYVWHDLLRSVIQFYGDDMERVGEPVMLRNWVYARGLDGHPIFAARSEGTAVPAKASAFHLYLVDKRGDGDCYSALVQDQPLYDERANEKNVCG